jgi:hypothetical protein
MYTFLREIIFGSGLNTSLIGNKMSVFRCDLLSQMRHAMKTWGRRDESDKRWASFTEQEEDWQMSPFFNDFVDSIMTMKLSGKFWPRTWCLDTWVHGMLTWVNVVDGHNLPDIVYVRYHKRFHGLDKVEDQKATLCRGRGHRRWEMDSDGSICASEYNRYGK